MLGLVLPALLIAAALPAAGIPLTLLALLIAVLVPAQISAALPALSLPDDLAGKVRARGPAGLGEFGLVPNGIALLTPDALVWLPLNGNPRGRRQIRLAGASVQMPRFPMLPGIRLLRIENAEDSLTLYVGERDQWMSRIEILQAEVGVVPWLATPSVDLPADSPADSPTETAVPVTPPPPIECRACATHLPAQARYCWQCGAAQFEAPSSSELEIKLLTEASSAGSIETAAVGELGPAPSTATDAVLSRVDEPLDSMTQLAVVDQEAPQPAAQDAEQDAQDSQDSQDSQDAGHPATEVHGAGVVPGSGLAQNAPTDSLVDRAAARLSDLETQASQLTTETLERIRKTVELTAWIDTDLDQVERLLRAPSPDGPAPAPPETQGKTGKRRKAKA
jgi:hypothetical protein